MKLIEILGLDSSKIVSKKKKKKKDFKPEFAILKSPGRSCLWLKFSSNFNLYEKNINFNSIK